MFQASRKSGDRFLACMKSRLEGERHMCLKNPYRAQRSGPRAFLDIFAVRPCVCALSGTPLAGPLFQPRFFIAGDRDDGVWRARMRPDGGAPPSW